MKNNQGWILYHPTQSVSFVSYISVLPFYHLLPKKGANKMGYHGGRAPLK